jgi:hypothetical protein
MRRLNSGVALMAQRFRLILDKADAAGHAHYPCKILDASAQGFGVICSAVELAPDLFQVGAQMTLEAADRKRLRVEIRWINKDRLGVKRLAANWA